MAKQKLLLPTLAVVLSSILWGLNPPFIKLGVETIPPVIFLSIRFLIASLVMLPFAIKTWRPLKTKDMCLLILGSVIFVSIASLTLNLGLARTNSINAGVLTLLGPLLLCILSVQFLKERLSVKTLVGIFVAFAGSIVIIGRPWDGSGASLTGNLLILISVLCFVLSTLIFKPLTDKVSTYQATFASFFFGVLPAAAYSLTQLNDWDIHAVTPASIHGLIGSIVIILGANFLFFYALHYKKAQDVAVYDYLQSVTTIVAAYFILAEHPSSNFIAGTLLVFAGIYLAEFSKNRKWRLR